MIPVALVLWGIGWLLLFRVPLCRRSPGTETAAASVSVIIPARNEAANLPALLASLQRQTPPPAEILVVDDGSTDATAEVARARGAAVLPGSGTVFWKTSTWPRAFGGPAYRQPAGADGVSSRFACIRGAWQCGLNSRWRG